MQIPAGARVAQVLLVGVSIGSLTVILCKVVLPVLVTLTEYVSTSPTAIPPETSVTKVFTVVMDGYCGTGVVSSVVAGGVSSEMALAVFTI